MERKRPNIRRQGWYGEKTVIRRVPLSVVPLLDCLLEKMRRAAQNDPRRTLQRVSLAVQRLADEERTNDERQEKKARSLSKADNLPEQQQFEI